MLKHAARGLTETVVSPIDEKMIQPNAIDLRVSRVFEHYMGEFVLDGDTKEHLEQEEVHPDPDGYFHLTSGVYVIQFAQVVSMGEREAGIVVSRSSLMRNGIWMTSALYDSGYHGKMVAGLSVPSGVTFTFPKGERLAQFLVMDSDAFGRYEGSYQGAEP